LPTTKTVEHWVGTALNPHDGITYRFNMVGKDPSLEQTSNIPTEVVPVNVVVGGKTFAATSVVGPTLASPLFANSDYAFTPHASVDTTGLGDNDVGFNSGGALSSGNANVQLQDAIMRSQFNKQGTPYHLILAPVNVRDPVTIVVPPRQGVLDTYPPTGLEVPLVSIQWFSAQIQNLTQRLGYMDPAHLPVFLTNGVMLYDGRDPNTCCTFGYHGAGPVSSPVSSGSAHGSGKQAVQTFVWSSWITPGTFKPRDWALQDVSGISHEIAEWATDPFLSNYVEPWLAVPDTFYGCLNVLESGDPVVGVGFSKGTNSFQQGPTPNGQQIADGTYHPSDEAFSPWFMRQAPNAVSQPTQSPSTNGGRYTFMGDLNPYPGFHTPATGC
jgi:hypothetical protein